MPVPSDEIESPPLAVIRVPRLTHLIADKAGKPNARFSQVFAIFRGPAWIAAKSKGL